MYSAGAQTFPPWNYIGWATPDTLCLVRYLPFHGKSVRTTGPSLDQPPSVGRTPNLEPFLSQDVVTLPYTVTSTDSVLRSYVQIMILKESISL